MSFLQGASTYDSDGTSSLAFPSNVAANSLLLVVVTANYGTDDAATAVSDTLGNSYTKIGSSIRGTNSYYVDVWYAVNAFGAGANTVNVTYDPSAYHSGFLIEEYDGPLAPDGYTGQAQYSVYGTDAATSGDFTPTQDGDLIWAVTFASTPSGGAISAGTGFTLAQDPSGWFGSYGAGEPWIRTEYLTQESAASIAGTFSTSLTTLGMVTIAVAFSPPPPPSPPSMGFPVPDISMTGEMDEVISNITGDANLSTPLPGLNITRNSGSNFSGSTPIPIAFLLSGGGNRYFPFGANLPRLKMTGHISEVPVESEYGIPLPELEMHGITGVGGSMDLEVPLPITNLDAPDVHGSINLTLPIPYFKNIVESLGVCYNPRFEICQKSYREMYLDTPLPSLKIHGLVGVMGSMNLSISLPMFESET